MFQGIKGDFSLLLLVNILLKEIFIDNFNYQ